MLKVLAAMRGYINENGYPPTVTELCDMLSLSRSTVHDHLRRLERAGLITRVVDGGVTRQVIFHDPDGGAEE